MIDTTKVKAVITEIVASMTRSASERDYRNEALKALAEENDLTVKQLRAIAKAAYKGNGLDADVEEMEETKELYDQIFGE